MVCINLNRLYSQGKICDLSKHSKYFRVVSKVGMSHINSSSDQPSSKISKLENRSNYWANIILSIHLFSHVYLDSAIQYVTFHFK